MGSAVLGHEAAVAADADAFADEGCRLTSGGAVTNVTTSPWSSTRAKRGALLAAGDDRLERADGVVERFGGGGVVRGEGRRGVGVMRLLDGRGRLWTRARTSLVWPVDGRRLGAGGGPARRRLRRRLAVAAWRRAGERRRSSRVAGLDGFERGDAVEQVAELFADLRAIVLGRAARPSLRGGRRAARCSGGCDDDLREAQLHLGDARVDGAAGAARPAEADAAADWRRTAVQRRAALAVRGAVGGLPARRAATASLRSRASTASRRASRRRLRLRRRWRARRGEASGDESVVDAVGVVGRVLRSWAKASAPVVGVALQRRASRRWPRCLRLPAGLATPAGRGRRAFHRRRARQSPRGDPAELAGRRRDLTHGSPGDGGSSELHGFAALEHHLHGVALLAQCAADAGDDAVGGRPRRCGSSRIRTWCTGARLKLPSGGRIAHQPSPSWR